MCYTDLEKLQQTFDSTVCPETLSSELPSEIKNGSWNTDNTYNTIQGDLGK